jgi:arylsulfatase
MRSKSKRLLAAAGLGPVLAGHAAARQAAAPTAAAAAKKPNVLVIWGDDIGTWNIGHDNRGMMG